MSQGYEPKVLKNKYDLFDYLDEIRLFLEKENITPKAIYATELALEELVTNVFRYGFENAEEASVEVKLNIEEPKTIRISFSDSGQPFNPVEQADPAKPASIEEAPIGGRGIQMVKKSVQKIEYQRIENQNVVTVQIDSAAGE